jgi:type I restriction-modification system DNA methylase subunit
MPARPRRQDSEEFLVERQKDPANQTLEKRLWEAADQLRANSGLTFGRIYEYFLGEFARTEGQKGGEFFTPSSIVRLIVQILEPYHGRVQTRLAVLVVCSFKRALSA